MWFVNVCIKIRRWLGMPRRCQCGRWTEQEDHGTEIRWYSDSAAAEDHRCACCLDKLHADASITRNIRYKVGVEVPEGTYSISWHDGESDLDVDELVQGGWEWCVEFESGESTSQQCGQADNMGSAIDDAMECLDEGRRLAKRRGRSRQP